MQLLAYFFLYLCTQSLNSLLNIHNFSWHKKSCSRSYLVREAFVSLRLAYYQYSKLLVLKKGTNLVTNMMPSRYSHLTWEISQNFIDFFSQSNKLKQPKKPETVIWESNNKGLDQGELFSSRSINFLPFLKFFWDFSHVWSKNLSSCRLKVNPNSLEANPPLHNRKYLPQKLFIIEPTFIII